MGPGARVWREGQNPSHPCRRFISSPNTGKVSSGAAPRTRRVSRELLIGFPFLPQLLSPQPPSLQKEALMVLETRYIWGCHSEPNSGLVLRQAGLWGQVWDSGKGCGARVAGVGGEGGCLSLLRGSKVSQTHSLLVLSGS